MASMVENAGKKPNLLITGTPGVGKTTVAESISEKLGFRHLNVGDLVKEHECHEGMDEALDTYILDEDKLLDLMEPMLGEGGCVVDFHSPEIFPERWFELVLVLRTETETLFDRLTKRGYSEKKRMENMECEIMQVVVEEARESYATEIVHEVPSNTLDDLDSALERVTSWYSSWQASNKPAST